MNISYYFRFKKTDSDKRIFHLVSKYVSNDSELSNFDNSLELHLKPDPELEIYILYSNEKELAEICFPDDKFCYGHFANNRNLIIGRRILKNSVIYLIVIEDQVEYSAIHYQAFKNGKYRDAIRQIRKSYSALI